MFKEEGVSKDSRASPAYVIPMKPLPSYTSRDCLVDATMSRQPIVSDAGELSESAAVEVRLTKRDAAPERAVFLFFERCLQVELLVMLMGRCFSLLLYHILYLRSYEVWYSTGALFL